MSGAPISIEDQILCVDREIGIRERVYQRWVKLGKLTQAAADLELQRMRAVRLTLFNARPAFPAEINLAVEAERERVLEICGKSMHSSQYVRAAAKARGG